MAHLELPDRRVEAWKYSDLRASYGDAPLPDIHAAPSWGGPDTIIARLAEHIGRYEAKDVIEGLVVHTIAGAATQAQEIIVAPGESLTRVLVMAASDEIQLDASYVRVGAGAHYRQFVLCEGAKLARSETHISVDGEGAKVELGGVYLCAAGGHADLTSVVTHKAPGAGLLQLIKGVARKNGRGVFQGKIFVEREAQQTDARQYHHGLLLEEGAEIFAKPELQIYADDVACAHGNTAGAIDEAALFYARSRGIPEAEARALLIEAFVLEAIPEGLPELVYDNVAGRIRTWLGTHA